MWGSPKNIKTKPIGNFDWSRWEAYPKINDDHFGIPAPMWGAAILPCHAQATHPPPCPPSPPQRRPWRGLRRFGLRLFPSPGKSLAPILARCPGRGPHPQEIITLQHFPDPSRPEQSKGKGLVGSFELPPTNFDGKPGVGGAPLEVAGNRLFPPPAKSTSRSIATSGSLWGASHLTSWPRRSGCRTWPTRWACPPWRLRRWTPSTCTAPTSQRLSRSTRLCQVPTPPSPSSTTTCPWPPTHPPRSGNSQSMVKYAASNLSMCNASLI